MTDVKWIKITTDIFDDEKILMIESLPEADSIIVIWFKLLCLAGKQNNSGVFMLNDRIPFTDKMLAAIFRRKESTVQLALQTFEKFGMIEVIDGVITIPNWGKHQNLDALERKTTYMRNYMKDYRKKQKQLVGATKNNAAGLDIKSWKTVLNEFHYECAYCGAKEDLEQDHVVPLNDGGTNTIGNIVPACSRCKGSKGAKEVFSWYKAQDFFDNDRCKHLRKYLRKYNVSCADKEIDEDIESEIEEECSSTGKKTEPISSTSTDKSLSSSLSGESSDAPRKKHFAESDKVFSPDSLAYKCAVYLAKDIKRCLPTTPEAKEKDLQRWADAFDKTNRLDGHPWEEIRYVLVHCRKDPFWQKNILSGKKFREKYVRLLAEATAPRPETKKSPGRRQSWSEVAREMANDLEGGEGSG